MSLAANYSPSTVNFNNMMIASRMTVFYNKSCGTMRHVRSGKILHIFPSGTESMGDRDPKRLTRVRGQVYTCPPNLVVIDQSW